MNAPDIRTGLSRPAPVLIGCGAGLAELSTP